MSTAKVLIWENGMEMSWVVGLGLGFLVVPKCSPRVERFRGLKLVQRLCSIWLVHTPHQKLVLLI